MNWTCTCESGYKGNVILCPLHAAAPDMYEALKEIIEECPEPGLPYGKRVVEIAKQALAKALGKEG